MINPNQFLEVLNSILLQSTGLPIGNALYRSSNLIEVPPARPMHAHWLIIIPLRMHWWVGLTTSIFRGKAMSVGIGQTDLIGNGPATTVLFLGRCLPILLNPCLHSRSWEKPNNIIVPWHTLTINCFQCNLNENSFVVQHSVGKTISGTNQPPDNPTPAVCKEAKKTLMSNRQVGNNF